MAWGFVKYSDQLLLLEFAKLQLCIASARSPMANMESVEKAITRTTGYKKLRRWFIALSPRKKERGRAWLQQQITGVATLLKQAAASGEILTHADLAEIEFSDRDATSGQPLPDPVRIEPEEPTQER